MKVSIITVCFNSASYIAEAIESVLSQKHNDIEYIIIDGGSTDGTLEIISQYSDRINLVISEPDNGIYSAMNKGIHKATGDIIGFLNSDDFYYNEDVLVKVEKIFRIHEVDSVYGNLIYVDKINTEKIVRYWESAHFKKGSFSKGKNPPHPAFFAKREVYEKYGCFDLEMKVSADFEIMLRFLEKHEISTSYLPEILVKMRIGGHSNRSIKNIFIGNKYILLAFRKNNIRVNYIFYPFYRLMPKLFEIIKNKF